MGSPQDTKIRRYLKGLLPIRVPKIPRYEDTLRESCQFKSQRYQDTKIRRYIERNLPTQVPKIRRYEDTNMEICRLRSHSKDTKIPSPEDTKVSLVAREFPLLQI